MRFTIEVTVYHHPKWRADFQGVQIVEERQKGWRNLPSFRPRNPKPTGPTGTGSSIQERKNLTFGAKNWCEHPDSSKIFDPLDFPWCFFLTNLRGFTAMLVGDGCVGNPWSRRISMGFFVARTNTWEAQTLLEEKTGPLYPSWDWYFYLYKYHKTQPFT